MSASLAEILANIWKKLNKDVFRNNFLFKLKPTCHFWRRCCVGIVQNLDSCKIPGNNQRGISKSAGHIVDFWHCSEKKTKKPLKMKPKHSREI